MTDSKTCTCCLLSKPLSAFPTNKWTKSGIGSWCHSCSRENAGWGRSIAYGKASQSSLTLEEWCRRAAKNAISNGLIHRPAVCDQCGAKVKSLIPHHTYPTKPLVVIWRCPACRREKK